MRNNKAKEKSSGLPVKLARPARRALTNAGIATLKQLSTFSEKDITELHGIGNYEMAAIKQALIENGVSFSKDKKLKK
jgi:DNA-directed RNA polymerase alpha subunit